MKHAKRLAEDAAESVRTGHCSDKVRLSKVNSARKAVQTSHYDSDEILSETASRICTEFDPDSKSHARTAD